MLKIGMKVQKDIAENLPSLLFGSPRAARAFAHEARTASFASTVSKLGVKEGVENWHEGTEGYCRQFVIVTFWIPRTIRTALAASFVSTVTISAT